MKDRGNKKCAVIQLTIDVLRLSTGRDGTTKTSCCLKRKVDFAEEPLVLPKNHRVHGREGFASPALENKESWSKEMGSKRLC